VDKFTEPEEADIDEEREELEQDSEPENSGFGGASGSEESVGAVSVRGEEIQVDEDCETPGMWDNIACVRNSEVQPGLDDSVSSLITKKKIYLL
jgi:hypothetical protein